MIIFLLTIGTGKTIKSDSPSQYGRATRHMDVFQCSVSALGFYLLHRLDVNGEWTNLPDFRDNSAWFDVKLLAEFGGESSKTMTQRPYQSAVKDVFGELGICSSHHGPFLTCCRTYLRGIQRAPSRIDQNTW